MTQEDFEEAKQIARKAKGVIRMLVMQKEANSAWYQQQQQVIAEFATRLHAAEDKDAVEVPEEIATLFQALPYSIKKKEIENDYDQYWDAWKGSNSVGVMLARLNTINRKHKYTEESDPDIVRIALCDALSQYSVRIVALEKNKFYIA